MNKPKNHLFSSDVIEIFESMPDAVIVCENEGNIMYCNAHTVQLFGFSREEMTGKNVAMLIPERYRAAHAKHLATYFSKPLPRPMGTGLQLFGCRNDEREFPADISLSPLHYKMKTYVVAAVRDMTERYQRETMYKELHERFQRLSEAAFEGIAIHENGIILETNQAMATIFGYTMEELKGKTALELAAPESHEIVLHKIRTQDEQPYEATGMRKDGTKFLAEIVGKPIHYEGRTARVTVLRDISEQKRMEEDVRKSEKKFRDLFTSAPVGIYQSSPDGDFLSANTMLATMLGYDAVNELLQQNLYDIYYYPHERDALIAEYARRGSIANVEILWKKKDGAPIWIELTAHAIKNENGRVTSFEGYVKDIAQRKQSGKRLLESEQKYSTLIETMREGLCYTNNDGLIQFVNARFCELLGYTPSELYGTHYFGLLFSDEDQRRAEAMRQAMQQNFLATQVFQLKKKNGDAIWIRANASVVFDEEGSLIGSVGIVDDISEQKNIEQTLQRRDAILEAVNVAAELFLTSECWEYEIRTVLQKLGEATEVSRIYLFETTSSPSGEIYASQRFEWVQTGEPQIDNPDLQMFPLRERGFQRWIDTLGNGETIYGHLKHFPPSEKEVLETQSIRSIVIVPIVVEKKWWGFMGYDECRCEREWSLVEIEALKTAANIIGAVITRTKMEEAKTRSEEQYRALFQEMQEVVFVATPQGQLLEVNPAGYKLFHFPFDKDLSSVNVIDAYVNPAQREALLKELTENGSVKDFEVHLNTGEGNEIDALLSATANRDKNGTLVTYRGMLRDITEKKILEEQILRAQQLESIGTLAGGIAHDFNNILGIILGYASLLETDKEHPERFSRDARAINSAVERGAGLVTQLLTFARKADAHLELLNVNRIVEDLHRFLSETLTKNISLQMQLGKKIPSIVADAKQLHQSLFNVCINARDAMPGGGTITLETSVVSGKEMQRRFREAQARDYVRIIVRDTGIGMDEKTKNRIFEPFFTTKDIGKGRGLGLSVAYGIIQNHNGFIDVESKLGNGTSFLLYFPMQWGIVETESETDDALPEGTETLLVVEDEALLRDFVKTILESVGYTVYEARNGEEAVEMYAQKKNEIQLVITDMGLPRLSGEAEFYQLKEINANVKVILASSYLEPSMKSELLKQGAKAFIQKPYEVHQLLQHVRNVLDVK